MTRVRRTRGAIAEIDAHPHHVHGNKVRYGAQGRGWICGLAANHTEIYCLDQAPRAGDAVACEGSLLVDVPHKRAGQVSVLGTPEGTPRPLFPRAPPIGPSRWRRTELGGLVFDVAYRVGTGQVLAMGPRNDLAVLHGLLSHQLNRGCTVIVVPGVGILPHWARWLPRALTVSATTQAQGAIAPLAALAMAEHYAAGGDDVVLALLHPETWMAHAPIAPFLPPWSTLFEGFLGRARSGDHGSVSIWLATSSVPTLQPGIDQAVDLRAAETGVPRSSYVQAPRPFRHSRNFYQKLGETQRDTARGRRYRGLLKFRQPMDLLSAVATFMALCDNNALSDQEAIARIDAVAARIARNEDVRTALVRDRQITTTTLQYLRQLATEVPDPARKG